MAESLAEKYRPKSFEEVFGNEETIIGLKTVCRRESGPPPAILLIGPRGCGKTTLAGIIKNELKIDDRDFSEYDAANTRGIDTMRDIKKIAQYAPFGGDMKGFFLDEAHKITPDGQNALLKLLEKPPANVIFILATTDPQLLVDTVRSRCMIYEVKLLPNKLIREVLNRILKAEKVSIPEAAINEICELSEGSPREAIMMLDSIMDIVDDGDLMKAIMTYNSNAATTKALCQALIENRPWKDIAKILQGVNDEPEKVRQAVLGYCMNILLVVGRDTARAAEVMINFMDSVMYTRKPGLVFACFLSCKK